MRIQFMALNIFLLLPLLRPAAEEASWFVSSGIHSGEIRELVYEGDEILSELVWPLDSLLTVTLGGSLPLGGGVHLSASLEAGSLLMDQSMTDSDYLNLPERSEKTHFSRHPVDMKQYLEFRGALRRPVTTGLSGVCTNRKIRISPGLEFRLSSAAWTGRDGYLQYGTWNGDFWNPWHSGLPKTETPGTVITWHWTRILLAASLSVDVPVGNRFLVSASILASPLIKADGNDMHVLTGTVFRDTMYGGVFLEPALRAEYRIASGYHLFAVGSWSYQADTRGDTRSGPVGGELATTFKGGGGNDMTLISFSLGLKKTTE